MAAQANESYWKKRAEEREAEWHTKSQQTIEKELADYYLQASHHIRDDIAVLYARFAADNHLDITVARQLIQGDEYRVWRMEIKDYVKQIEITRDQKLLLELNTLAMRSRITRLDKLYGETIMELSKMAEKVEGRTAGFLKEAFKDGYYHGLYDIVRGGKMKLPVTKVDAEQLQAVLQTPWSGKNYSQRLWKNTDELSKTIRTEILGGIHRGASVQEMARNVSERMESGRKESIRLVRTEMNYAQNRAAMESIKDAGMKYFVFIATLDRRTSATCRNHDGHIYKISEAEPGTNVPPLHPYCRSTIAASLHGPEGKQDGTRIGRDPDGKAVHVPAAMKYDDWKAVYIDQLSSRADWDKAHLQKTVPAVAEPVNKRGQKISFDFKSNADKFKQSEAVIQVLASEYGTNLEKVTTGAQKAAGDVDMSGSTMRLSNSNSTTAVHEFAHTLANSKATEYGVQYDDDFWKEIKKLHRKYVRNVGDDSTRWVSTYEHSSRSIDEFFAEAFTQAKASSLGIELPGKYGTDHTWSTQVLATVNKYFGKNKDSTVELPSAIIKPSDAHEFKVKGFPNKQKLNNHFKNGRTHQEDYEGWTKEQYQARAVELVQQPVGGNILGHVDADGNVIRYDKKTNEFVKGHPNKGIKTLFKPKEGKVYYDDQVRRDIEHGGKS